MGYALFLFVRDFRAEQLFMWSFFVLNIAGFVTYHLYPAAPPWYFHLHGCTVDLAAPASAGPNLTRVDAWLGISYFAGFYGRSSDVFGAVPSLHVAYPLLMALSGWKKHGALGRTLLVAFYLWMCFAAVYLDHHWVIDVALGSVYTVVVVFAMRALARFARSASPVARSCSGRDPPRATSMAKLMSDRASWGERYVRFIVRHGALLWGVALLLAIPATIRTVSLYVHLKSDIEELLPRGAPSVAALDEIRARMPGLRYLGILVDTKTAENLAPAEKFLDDLCRAGQALSAELGQAGEDRGGRRA